MIEEVLREAGEVRARLYPDSEIVAVDDASTDGSHELMLALVGEIPGLRVLRHPENQGNCRTVEDAFRAARCPWVFVNGADGQWRSAELLRMIPLAADADLVIGRRRVKCYTPWRRLVSAVFNRLPQLLYGVGGGASPRAILRALADVLRFTHLMVVRVRSRDRVVGALRELVEAEELGELLYYDSKRVNLGLFQPDVDVIWDPAPTGPRRIVPAERAAPAPVGYPGDVLTASQQKELLEAWRRASTAGLAMDRSLELLVSAGQAEEDRRILRELAAAVRRGRSLADERARLEALLGAGPAALILAGEQSGSLDEALAATREQAEGRLELRNKVLLALAYPALMALAAVVLIPVPMLWTQGLGAAFLRFYLPLMVLLAVVGGSLWTLRRRWQEGGEVRLALERSVLATPLLGTLLRAHAAALFFTVLASMLRAGVSVLEAVEAAGRASGAETLARGVRLGVRELERGGRLQAALRGTGFFSDAALRQVAIGEETGELPELCAAQARLEAEEVQAGGTRLAVTAGGAAMLVVGLVMVWHIVSFWAAYFQRGAEMGLY